MTRLTHHGPGEYVTAAAFSPDGRTIAYSSWNGISILDIETGESRLVQGATELRLHRLHRLGAVGRAIRDRLQ